eukprot:CAMPEP_0195028116 /NCGR_PEP_ID=MMETSP0326_2-20130528/53749_1 /TAXON_ID=2866 ORGANISM="Crypthecodinium cohnii, Strain Seligo" /NCGR_SAMPLE_ID=MMETSP0326_2 /ASSEMBLY_ACC=CAM_ASM_000348 /LENGTH=69 /DNA_ID=CAMNT_0040050531 /DNA_START=320 /DNA_END=526 /DNA_ORIENTATION=+
MADNQEHHSCVSLCLGGPTLSGSRRACNECGGTPRKHFSNFEVGNFLGTVLIDYLPSMYSLLDLCLPLK